MNKNGDEKSATRLFQANIANSETAVMIAAADINCALEHAIDCWGAPPSGILLVDVTDQFLALSGSMPAHTRLLERSRLAGMVEYDDELGWRFADHPAL